MSEPIETSETSEELEAKNTLLFEMVRNQKTNMKNMVRVFVVTVVCYTLLLISMVVGFFWYESQFDTTVTTTTSTTTTQEVSGENSEINNVEGNLYKDNATHNQN